MLYRFAHKTGVYAVEVVEEQGDQVLVKVLQVIKHPKQGDLHHPNEVEGVFFHERKALSLYEKRYTSPSRLKPFEGEVEDYTVTLQRAISKLENELQDLDTPFAHASLDCLTQLKADYARQYKTNFS
ncbi:sporulation phosphorelay system protein KapB [Staphylococcus intermedius]|uniref:Kinase-associated lipoprotein B n=1 Tax=Staphylococcus intermedius NCTC 11048 TaxID=1141106 RepID=A0A380GAB7_STAIN|nr:sporulation phosphorelay system protein KapB [Staphylococcus intermedius]PCF65358.1 kinase [Staphylococcus intermedius]PCF81036.1 kinase [Staphylococcus intermedius]PCF82318.1 kinase [Staphylococcus intermedius]PCF87018.1 kinase [Staphylococcus intermedius]PCF87579.1 kinase [Staphylococcus intermedius]